MLFHVCFKDTTGTKHMHFAQMQWRINWTFLFWVQNWHVNLRPQSLKRKKHIQPLKTKQPGPKVLSLLLLLFLENKRCMHNEEGICTEILPERDKTNNSNTLSSSIFLYLQAQAFCFWEQKLYACTMRRGLYRILLGTDNT